MGRESKGHFCDVCYVPGIVLRVLLLNIYEREVIFCSWRNRLEEIIFLASSILTQVSLTSKPELFTHYSLLPLWKQFSHISLKVASGLNYPRDVFCLIWSAFKFQHWKKGKFLNEIHGFMDFGGRLENWGPTRLHSHCLEQGDRAVAVLFRLGMCLPVNAVPIISASNTLGLLHSFFLHACVL